MLTLILFLVIYYLSKKINNKKESKVVNKQVEKKITNRLEETEDDFEKLDLYVKEYYNMLVCIK